MIYLISFIFIVIGIYLLCREWNRGDMPDIPDWLRENEDEENKANQEK